MSLRGGPLRSSASAVTVPGWRVGDLHRLLTDFFEEGVVQGNGDALEVVQHAAGANMSVDVGSGLALIEVTTTLLSPDETHKTWLLSDATENVAVPEADLTNPRIDRIVASFDMTADPNGAASNIVDIELIEGTPAGSPSAPATPSNAISLALVDVAAGAVSIETADITDDRAYVTLDTGVLADVTRTANLASTATGKGASLIGVEDDGGNFTGTDLETVLVELAGAGSVPTGAILIWTTDSAPTGFLLCYGQSLERVGTYADLFAVIGTAYGAADGDHFNVPDLRGRFPLGQDDMGGSAANRVTDTDADTLGAADGDETKTIAEANLPAHTHGLPFHGSGGSATTFPAAANPDSGTVATYTISTGPTGSGTAMDIMPPFITLNYIIKT